MTGFMKVDDNIYLKSIFQLKVTSWLLGNLGWNWSTVKNLLMIFQLKENSSWENPGNEWDVKLLNNE